MSKSPPLPANLLTPSPTEIPLTLVTSVALLTPSTTDIPLTPTPTNITSPSIPLIASRDVFFPLTLHTRPFPLPPSSPEQPLFAPAIPPTPYENALARVQELNEFLTPAMKCTLSAMLSVVNTHLSPPSTSVDGPISTAHPLVTGVASRHSPDEIKDLADTIEKGLDAFAALGGGSSVKAPSETGSSTGEPSELGVSTGPRKRQRIGPSYRSAKVRQHCAIRDPNCQICNAKGGDVSHIIPYSVKDKKAIDFWKFVELFSGPQATMALKAIALAPNPDLVDNLKNVWTLCKTCHELFGRAKLAIIPDLDGLTYPFDANSTSTVSFSLPPAVQPLTCRHQYNAAIEFPSGNDGIGIASWRHEPNGRARLVRQLDEGDVITLSTHNALGLPLPHPLLFQLHAIISRVIGMKAAAGFATFPDRDCGSAGDFDHAVPVFVDTRYLQWLDHQDTHPVDPDLPEHRYDTDMLAPHIMRWFKLMPSPRLIGGRAASEVVSESVSETGDDHFQEHHESSDTDEEHPRDFTVVLSEIGQRMDEKWQLARSRRGCDGYEEDADEEELESMSVS